MRGREVKRAGRRGERRSSSHPFKTPIFRPGNPSSYQPKDQLQLVLRIVTFLTIFYINFLMPKHSPPLFAPPFLLSLHPHLAMCPKPSIVFDVYFPLMTKSFVNPNSLLPLPLLPPRFPPLPYYPQLSHQHPNSPLMVSVSFSSEENARGFVLLR